MKNCIYCGAELPDEAEFCAACGATLEDNITETIEDVKATEPVDAIEEMTTEAMDSVEGCACGGTVPCEEDAESLTDAELVEADGEEAGIIDEDEETVSEKKGGWNITSTIVVIVAAVVVAALVVFMGFKEGWIHINAKSVCTIGDYSTIEILSSSVEVSDDTVDSYIDSLLSDDVDDEGNVPELTDEWCEEYSAAHLPETYKTVEEFKAYANDYVYTYFLHAAMMDYLQTITTIKSYDEVKEAELAEYSMENLEYYASYYGTTVDYLAQMYGYDDADAYTKEEADEYLVKIMILDKIISKEKLNYSSDLVDTDMAEYMKSYGYDETYTIEEFKEISGEVWCYLYENLQVKYDFVMDALEDRVVIVEATEE